VVEIDVRTTGLLPETAVQELVAVTAAITNVPAAESGRVIRLSVSPEITVQVFGTVVKGFGTEAEQVYQAIETKGVGVPVTVAVAVSTDPTCLLPFTPAVTTGAEDISGVEAVTTSVTPSPERLTVDVALTLATMYFPPSTSLGTKVEPVCPATAVQSELTVTVGSAFAVLQLNH
jgi:hypothetical protein